MKAITRKGREFDPADLSRAYRRLDPGIIADLAGLCFADKPTFDPDPRVDAYNQGRRHVWLHINQYLTLTPQQIEEMLMGKGVFIGDEGFENG